MIPVASDLQTQSQIQPQTLALSEKPRLAFLGVGWIGRNRMEAIAKSGMAEIAIVSDTSPDNLKAAMEAAPGAVPMERYEDILQNEDIDAVVIATPSALHAAQAIDALEAGKAVFCQKPLGRTLEETEKVVEAARKANLLLGVDLSYRHTQAMQKVYEVVRSGQIGEVFAIDLTFHNAYGPDKPWFYDPLLSGGGCVMDLGVHLVDLALWSMGFPEVRNVSGELLRQGKKLSDTENSVEDFATAQFELGTGTQVRLTCSWNLHAGQEALIGATFYGTTGGAAFRNINGSFYEFVAEQYQSTKSERLASPPDDWMGRAAVVWVEELARQKGFNETAKEFNNVAYVLDAIYGR